MKHFKFDSNLTPRPDSRDEMTAPPIKAAPVIKRDKLSYPRITMGTANSGQAIFIGTVKDSLATMVRRACLAQFKDRCLVIQMGLFTKNLTPRAITRAEMVEISFN